jgi:hypothetical protein
MAQRTMQSSSMPTDYKAQPVASRKFRFLVASSDADSVLINRACLLSQIMVYASGNTGQCAFMIQSCLLKRVQIWGLTNEASQGTTTIAIEWASNLGKSVEISRTGNAFNPPYIQTPPPKNSTASFWSRANNNETEILFYLTAPVGTIIDIEMDMVFGDGPTSRGVLLGSYSPGNSVVFYAYLDCLDATGAAAGTQQLVPVSVTVNTLASSGARTPVTP